MEIIYNIISTFFLKKYQNFDNLCIQSLRVYYCKNVIKIKSVNLSTNFMIIYFSLDCSLFLTAQANFEPEASTSP